MVKPILVVRIKHYNGIQLSYLEPHFVDIKKEYHVLFIICDELDKKIEIECFNAENIEPIDIEALTNIIYKNLNL